MKTAVRTAVVVLALALVAPGASAETYGNYTTMGVIVDCPEGVQVEDVGRVRLYLMEGGKRVPQHDLVQVGFEPYFAGSLFWLEPDTEYSVEVDILDKSGGVLATVKEKGRTRPEPVVPETAVSLFVSPDGDDSNPGTSDKPLKSVAAGIAKLRPGTTLFLREGLYEEGDITLPRGGTSDAPIVIRAAPGERAVLSGESLALRDGGWSEGSADTWNAPFEGSTWAATAEDRETGIFYRLYPLRTMEELTSRRSAGKTFEQLGFTGAYYCDGERIHVVTPGGPASKYLWHVSNRTHGFILDGVSNVCISGIEFRNYGKNDYAAAVRLYNASEVVITGCRVFHTNTGVWLKGACNNVTVQDSTFTDDVDHWHFGYSKNEEGWNYHSQIETGAVATDGNYTGRGLVVRRNKMTGLFDGSHLGPWVTVAKTSETDFCENVMDGITDDFVETDGYSRNVRIFANSMDKSLSGISLAQALDGPTWILYNLNTNCGISTGTSLEDYEGYPFKTNGGPKPQVGSGPVFFYHNTSWTSDPKSRAMLVKSNVRWRYLVLYNNIWCGKAMGFDKWSGDLSPMEWDYDNLYHEAGPFMKYAGATYPTLAEARAALRILPHGISADPLFADPEGGDFSLRRGSPCIDSGLVIEGINDRRFGGKAPDMGALESR